jgi:hypothetical protein
MSLGDHSPQATLDDATQLGVGCELGRLRATHLLPGASVGPGRAVAGSAGALLDLAADRRRNAADLLGDRAQRLAVGRAP